MKIERIDRQTAPLVEGQFYLVPIVRAKWNGGRLAAWPVMGPLHQDVEFFSFGWDHYHVDPRFLARGFCDPWRVFNQPLHIHGGNGPQLPTPVMSRRKCVRSHLPYVSPPYNGGEAIAALRSHFAGTQCASGKGGWICPHRKASLGSILPVDGIITCPLHGLRIDAATGKVLKAK